MIHAAKKIAAIVTAKGPSLALIAVAGLLVCSTGCSTPAYSARERGQIIARNWGLEWQMAQDDIDEALLLRPVTTLSRWNIR